MEAQWRACVCKCVCVCICAYTNTHTHIHALFTNGCFYIYVLCFVSKAVKNVTDQFLPLHLWVPKVQLKEYQGSGTDELEAFWGKGIRGMHHGLEIVHFRQTMKYLQARAVSARECYLIHVDKIYQTEMK